MTTTTTKLPTAQSSSTGGVITFFPWGLRHSAGRNFSGSSAVNAVEVTDKKIKQSKKNG